MFVRMVFSLKFCRVLGKWALTCLLCWQQKASWLASEATSRKTLGYLDAIINGYTWTDQLLLQGGGGVWECLVISWSPTLTFSVSTLDLSKHSVLAPWSQLQTSPCSSSLTAAPGLCVKTSGATTGPGDGTCLRDEVRAASPCREAA